MFLKNILRKFKSCMKFFLYSNSSSNTLAEQNKKSQNSSIGSTTNSEYAKVAKFTVAEFNKDYYEEHKESGLDYLGHGYWQEAYARMVNHALFQAAYPTPLVVDLGCACGSILKGFQKTGIYDRVLGVDVNDHMLDLGRQHFTFSEEDLVCASADNLPLQDGSVTLVHSAQVLEHIPESLIPGIIAEMQRVLVPGGRAFIALDAVRKDEQAEQYMGDPTHCTLQPVEWWTALFHAAGFLFDIEAYDRYARAEEGPTLGDPRSFFQAYDWSVWCLLKPKS